MAGDFGKQSGKFGPAPTRDPKTHAAPSAGITNESKGNCVCPANDHGVKANGKRIS